MSKHVRSKQKQNKYYVTGFIVLQTSPLKLGEQRSNQAANVTFLPLLSTFTSVVTGCCCDDGVVGCCSFTCSVLDGGGRGAGNMAGLRRSIEIASVLPEGCSIMNVFEWRLMTRKGSV